MLKLMFSFGVVMTLGSGAVAYDYMSQSGKTPGKTLALADYADALQFRVVDLMEKELGPRIASLPQIAKGMTSATFGGTPQSTEEQIDDFASGSPQLQAMVEADRAAAKEGWWARIRHKVAGKAAPEGNRLSAIRERNFPTRQQGIEPSSLSGMSATELYSNRAAISKGLSTTAMNRMNDVVGDMKDMGIDMSAYE